MKKLYALNKRPWYFIAVRALCMLLLSIQFCATAFAQGPQTVKGNVVDENNNPLPGVTVAIKGTQKATTSNINGQYVINADANDVLRFTFVGSTPKEENVGNRKIINITLRSDAKALKDVVVIGYGTSSKKEVTSSITTVKADDFNTGVLSTPAELLQGKVAGLNISKSGDPNSTPSTVLRGPSTITGSTEPFYVIDGVPGASIDLLAPADIESIDVLKDASASAIYGNRASNGVIMVTTRKAKPGQTRLNYNAYASTEAASNQIHVLTGPQLRQYLADNKQTPLVPTLNDDGSDTNWQNLVERRSYSQNQNLSFSGASPTADYGVTANYMTNNGIIKTTSMSRVILKGYVNQRFFNNRLKLGLTVTNSHTVNNNVPVSSVISESVFYLPTVSPYNADGSYKEYYDRTGSGNRNPLSLIYNNILKTDDRKTLYNGIASIDILKGLKYTISASVQEDQTDGSTYYNSQSGLAIGLNGQAQKTSYLNTNTIVESFFNYDRDFGKHSLKLVGGYSYQYDKLNDGFGVKTQNFIDDALTYNNISLSNPASLSQIQLQTQNVSATKLISFYGRAQYNYDSKYLFQASLRNDGSSVFGTNHKWGYFPSVSAGWNISDEDFMKKIPVINYLKLRAGYGVTGNSAGINAFSAIVIYGPAGKFLYNGNITNTVSPTQNDNPNLKWESTGTLNIGLDFGILKDRISGTIEYYNKNTSDLLFGGYSVSTTQYFVPTIAANVGKVNNKGVELTLNFTPVKTSAFNWKTSMNFAHNHNEVVSLSNDIFQTPYINTADIGGKGTSGLKAQRILPGYPLGQFFLWHYAGKNAAGVSTYQKPDGSVIAQQPLTTDAMLSGNAQPSLIYGWTNSFTYKNFDLNFVIRGTLGNKIFNNTLAALNDPQDAKVQNIPTFTLGESYNDVNAYLPSDRFLENGSYLRLDNATLGYTIKPHDLSIKAIRFYLSGNNLFLITSYRGIDPEINIGGQTPGIDSNNFYPKTRTFLCGVSATF
ncbi:iron complex outermembrane receptor protein [Mucilaginibacter yixingensis]|uniref:Iron complex outermembrane receptor protein n=1 Tax=Mucilaginibacter yixingensis TaxID=1295612 RepID=A0A2T5JGB6_9SPHI|nr:TonB-dependent receptor [Mucilaginibacter yixingensis]PTR01459.1 iron complex outermembrane receptor protein [Mucilaginibacter yixingensis]